MMWRQMIPNLPTSIDHHRTQTGRRLGPRWILAVAVAAVLAADQISREIAYALLDGGVLGNLVDGFQDRHFFPQAAVVHRIGAKQITFNLADIFLLVAVAMLPLVSSRKRPETGTE